MTERPRLLTVIGMHTKVTTTTPASRADVYAVLTHLDTYCRWAGEDQLRPFRLLAIAGGPDVALTVGDEWSSRGKIPLHRPSFDDHSRVTEAEPGRAFEYVTESRIARRGAHGPREATYRHRYQLVADGSGVTSITYTMTELRSAHPMLRMAIPGLRAMTWATGVRLMARRGAHNIARLASQRAAIAA